MTPTERKTSVTPTDPIQTPAQAPVQAELRGRRLTLIVTTLIAVAFSIYILQLPIFPSNDGPIHLYYAGIIRDLLFNKGAHFGAFYVVKHHLPPYFVYYFLLIVLGKVMSFVAADKVIVCLYIFCFAFGLRYLARSIGPSGDAMALAATPLLFNWSMAMGFLNFCLSTALAFWALGLWIRGTSAPSHRKRALFLVLVFVTLLTHAVPLMLLIGFCGLELAIRLLRLRSSAASGQIAEETVAVGYRNLVADIVTFVLSLTTYAYIRFFTIANVLVQHGEGDGTFRSNLYQNIRNLLTLHSITPFYFTFNPFYLVFRFLVRILLPVCLGLAVLQLLRDPARAQRIPLLQRWTPVYTWTLLAFLALVAMPFVPSDLNGAYLFADRLHMYVWLTAAVAASGYVGATQKLRVAGATLAVVLTVQTLVMAHVWFTPLAYRFSDSVALPSLEGHHMGLMLYDTTNLRAQDLSTSPYLWSATNLFRRSGTVMYNSPWLRQAYLPLGAYPTLGYCCFTARELEEANVLKKHFVASPGDFDNVMRRVDFIVIVNGAEPYHAVVEPLLASDTTDPTHPWNCRPYDWYSFCERKR